jgi:hypothetical protein
MVEQRTHMSFPCGQIGAEQEPDQRPECLHRDVEPGAAGGQMAHRAQVGRHPEPDGPHAPRAHAS